LISNFSTDHTKKRKEQNLFKEDYRLMDQRIGGKMWRKITALLRKHMLSCTFLHFVFFFIILGS
jgi:hypothetical protein